MDGSDILLNVVQSLVTTRACSARFLLDGAGLIVFCSGIAVVLEDVDEDGVVVIPIVAELSCGHQMRIGNTKYGAHWEQH